MTTQINTINKGIVTVHNKWIAKVSGYTVYNNKVYRVVVSEGSLKDFSLTLESTVNNERFSVKQPESGLLKELLLPTGYMEV